MALAFFMVMGVPAFLVGRALAAWVPGVSGALAGVLGGLVVALGTGFLFLRTGAGPVEAFVHERFPPFTDGVLPTLPDRFRDGLLFAIGAASLGVVEAITSRRRRARAQSAKNS